MSDKAEIITNKAPDKRRKIPINRRAYRDLLFSSQRSVKASREKQYHMSREQVAAAYRAKGIIR